MKIFKILSIGIVLTTVVSCSSLEVVEVPVKGAPSNEVVRLPSSQTKSFRSIGIYSPGDPLRGDLMLEQSLSDALYRKKIRNLTSSMLLKQSDSRELKPVMKLLKKDKFEALLVIKELEIITEVTRSPSATVGNTERGTLLLPKTSQPLTILTAKIEFIDLSNQRPLWSGVLTFQDTHSLPLLIDKTADGIAKYLETKQLIP
ncbi:MAG: hypothetical protein FJ112_02175 [Deltaproteobacteria bacterium]|nr:hypothetical protein [Deltaproteobacteria bacterium]